MIDREIKYNRETKDFDCYVDSRYVGSRANYRAGDELCDEIAFDLCEQGLVDEPPPVCETCDGDGTVRAYGHGDQDNGYAQTCPDCGCTDAEPATALLADCAAVIRAALGGPVANGGIVDDLRRVEARLRSYGW